MPGTDRLTRSLFHAPSPFEFPRHPLSPPETTPDTASNLPAPASVVGASMDQLGDIEYTTETSGARFRRGSSLAYHSSGIRERPISRSHKTFLVVIPPPNILQEHGQLGHTLSLGPRHRLKQGLIMPLFPTMYAQLTAIAKEFNFPSTAGLCLYLHYTDNGITLTPRVSDDAWPMVWSRVLESPSNSGGLPISGKVEFDIDFTQARWYATWIASAHRREPLDMPISLAPSTSAGHFREHSHTTADEDDTYTNARQPRSTVRHVPRQLSLVDRFDAPSVRSANRTLPRSGLSPPDNVISASQVLSPIDQVEEPKSIIVDIENKVQTWRASASFEPSALVARGQTSIDPANMPNMLSLDSVVAAADDDELRLEDFAWSVSSLGPNDYDPESPISWERVPSVHLERRMVASVCMTPSDCTSFGPSDYTLPSLPPDSPRVVTPDLAARMFEDCPLTPLTATSWGPPSVYPDSPTGYFNFYAPSLDLGERATSTRPPTPSTATSWGPASWPASPVIHSRPRSIHLADRGEFSLPVTPSTATSRGIPVVSNHQVEHTHDVDARPWQFSWPYITQDNTRRILSDSFSEIPGSVPWEHVWPYLTQDNIPRFQERFPSEIPLSIPWEHVWPYTMMKMHQTPVISVELAPNYPTMRIYTPAYPFIEIYPALSNVQDSAPSIGYPEFCIYPPVQLAEPTIKSSYFPVVVKLPAQYPMFDIYPTTYPDSVYSIYPPIIRHSKMNMVSAAASYPVICPYQAVYPHVVPYPTVQKFIPDENMSNYPAIHIYMPGKTLEVPVLQVSPYVPLKHTVKDIVTHLQPYYPYFNLYPAAYPALNVYPEILKKVIPYNSDPGYPHFKIYPARHKGSSRVQKIFICNDSRGYHHFNLYPSASSPIADGQKVESFHGRRVAYHRFDLYPPPESSAVVNEEKTEPDRKLDVVARLGTLYPAIVLYPAVYPVLEIYPPKIAVESQRLYTVPTYLAFNIYPALYPHIVPYPSVGEVNRLSPRMKSNCGSIKLSGAYPYLDIYPSVYPYLTIYPALLSPMLKNDITHQPVYTQLNAYSTSNMSMHLSVNPSRPAVTTSVECRLDTRYPAFDLYPAVYPHFRLWPVILAPAVIIGSRRRKTHLELHNLAIARKQISPRTHEKLISRKTHKVLHDSVLPSGGVSSPSMTRNSDISTRPDPPQSSTKPQTRTLGSRRSSIALPENKGLPPHPGYHRLSIGDRTQLERSDTTPSTPIPPIRRSFSTNSRPQHTPKPDNSSLSTVEEHHTSGLTRANSSALPSRSGIPRITLDRSYTDEVVALRNQRKRDSLVLQRIRALEKPTGSVSSTLPNCADVNADVTSSPRVLMDNIDEFPMPPPAAPLPPVPRRPSKYAPMQ